MGSTTRWHSRRKLEAPKRSTRLSDRGQSSERRNEVQPFVRFWRVSHKRRFRDLLDAD